MSSAYQSQKPSSNKLNSSKGTKRRILIIGCLLSTQTYSFPLPTWANKISCVVLTSTHRWIGKCEFACGCSWVLLRQVGGERGRGWSSLCHQELCLCPGRVTDTSQGEHHALNNKPWDEISDKGSVVVELWEFGLLSSI